MRCVRDGWVRSWCSVHGVCGGADRRVEVEHSSVLKTMTSFVREYVTRMSGRRVALVE
jgi:hypothetical protein